MNNNDIAQYQNLQRNWQARLAAPMFSFSIIFLVAIAILIQRLQHGALNEQEFYYTSLLFSFLWIPFIVEVCLHGFLLLKLDQLKQRWLFISLVLIFPPFRMGLRCWDNQRFIWLPKYQIVHANRQLFSELEATFSMPMLGMTLLTLPLLLGDFYLKGDFSEYPWLAFILDMGTASIWFAFTLEFIIMVSVSNRWLQYCKKHWLDLLIILLPLIAMLRSLRLLKLQSLTRFVRVSRLKGLGSRLMRALLLASWVQRLTHRNAEKRLKKLRLNLADKLREVRKLKREMKVLELVLEESQDVSRGTS